MNRTPEQEQELRRLIAEQLQDIEEEENLDDIEDIAFNDRNLRKLLPTEGCYKINKCASLDEYDNYGEDDYNDDDTLSILRQFDDE